MVPLVSLVAWERGAGRARAYRVRVRALLICRCAAPARVPAGEARILPISARRPLPYKVKASSPEGLDEHQHPGPPRVRHEGVA